MYAALRRHHPLSAILTKVTGTQAFDLVLRVDECLLDCDFSNLLNNQRNAAHLLFAARNTRKGLYLVPTPRIYRRKETVHMGPTHVRFTRMEINNHIVSFPSVGHVPQQRLARSHSNLITEVRRAYFSGPKSNRYPHALDVSSHASKIRKLAIRQDEGSGGRDGVEHLVKIFSKPAPDLVHPELLASLLRTEVIPFPNLFDLEFPQLRLLRVTRVEARPEIIEPFRHTRPQRVAENRFIPRYMPQDRLFTFTHL